MFCWLAEVAPQAGQVAKLAIKQQREKEKQKEKELEKKQEEEKR